MNARELLCNTRHSSSPVSTNTTWQTERIAALAMVLAILFSSHPAQGSVNDNIKPGSDIMMKGLRWPEWDAGTYYCTWYAGFTPKGSVRNNFYGGVRTRGPKGPTGMFWTFWGDIKGVSSGKQFYGGSGYGAEGAAGGFNGRPDFLRPNAWYRFVVRVYPPKKKGKAGKVAYVGWWIKDVERGAWYHHSTVELLGPATGLFLCNANGIFKSTDEGKTFSLVFESEVD